MDSTSWLGVPVTVPTPVTVMRAGLDRTGVIVAACADEPPLWPAPRLKAPIRSAADATPAAAARYPGLMLLAMTRLLLRGDGGCCPCDAAGAPVVPSETRRTVVPSENCGSVRNSPRR